MVSSSDVLKGSAFKVDDSIIHAMRRAAILLDTRPLKPSVYNVELNGVALSRAKRTGRP